jgi:hypothetical protein
MKFKEVKDSGGGFHVSLTCEFCGQPITKTSRDFGMDCVNDCARKRLDPKALAALQGFMREQVETLEKMKPED